MKGFIIAIAMLVSAPFAHADLLLEPYIGYVKGSYEAGPGTEEDWGGIAFGGRVGYQTLGFMIGADYLTGKMEDDADPSSDLTPGDLGVFVGYNFPILLRVYGVYSPMAKLKSDDGTSSDTYEGTSMRLGVGTTFLPFVSVNLEYWTAEYDEADAGPMNPAVESTGYALTVSLPLTF
jgi:hypothetical protein